MDRTDSDSLTRNRGFSQLESIAFGIPDKVAFQPLGWLDAFLSSILFQATAPIQPPSGVLDPSHTFTMGSLVNVWPIHLLWGRRVTAARRT